DLPRVDRLQGRGQGGQWWHAVAGSDAGSRRSSPPTSKGRRRRPRAGRRSSSCRWGRWSPTATSPVRPSTTRPWPRSPPPSASRARGGPRPGVARPAGADGRYGLSAGERRGRAARRAGLDTIPAIVRSADELGSLEQAVVENLHRADLNAMEEAAAYQQLIEEFQLTHEQAAARVGKSRVAVTNALPLFQLPASPQKLVADGALTRAP